MGTNYYLHQPPCEHCGRSNEPMHIGKSSAGWTFSFHAMEDLRSWVKMREYIAKLVAVGWEIRDEYGDPMSLGDLEKMIEVKRSDKLNHTKYCQINHPQLDCWLDEQGNSFQSGEFS